MTTTHRASELVQATASAWGASSIVERPGRLGTSHLGTSLARLFGAFSTWRRRRRQSAELQAQSDFVLADIGLPRSKIELDRERISQWARLEWL